MPVQCEPFIVLNKVLKINMSEVKIPLIKLEDEKFQVVVDLALYAKESIVSACYKFTDRFYIHQQINGDNVVTTFETKDGNIVTEEIVKKFCNELIDQQVRYNTNLQFGHIRDLIVEEAFKPINK